MGTPDTPRRRRRPTRASGTIVMGDKRPDQHGRDRAGQPHDPRQRGSGRLATRPILQRPETAVVPRTGIQVDNLVRQQARHSCGRARRSATSWLASTRSGVGPARSSSASCSRSRPQEHCRPTWRFVDDENRSRTPLPRACATTPRSASGGRPVGGRRKTSKLWLSINFCSRCSPPSDSEKRSLRRRAPRRRRSSRC